jgi:hypothetical protein
LVLSLEWSKRLFQEQVTLERAWNKAGKLTTKERERGEG